MIRTTRPYGWTHALTLPQAVIRLAGDGVDVWTAVAVAGTFLLGFRLAHGTVELGSLADDVAVPITPRRSLSWRSKRGATPTPTS